MVGEIARFFLDYKYVVYIYIGCFGGTENKRPAQEDQQSLGTTQVAGCKVSN